MDSGVLEVEWLEQVTLIRLKDQGSEILACHCMRTCSIYIHIMIIIQTKVLINEYDLHFNVQYLNQLETRFVSEQHFVTSQY